ncbi:MAG: alanine--tRNA ligase, partial [Patescibacteria group bacterium]
NAALHKVLGDQVSQKGSDITAERARFDFSFNRKLMPEEIKRVEDLVNGAIAENYPVTAEVMDLADAKKSGALYFGGASYPDRVKVYSIGPSSDSGSPFSRELCGGPHVERTGELGRFRITKEEASSAGVRRMRIIVE